MLTSIKTTTIRNTLFFIVTLFVMSYSEAQNSPSFHPFNGFHLGVTGQTEYVQKCSFVPLTGSDPAPKEKWSFGWEAGIEFSYHFAKYFGIAMGINFGTVVSYDAHWYLSTVPYMGGWKEVNEYEGFIGGTPCINEFIFPIKVEFHYPLGNRFFFATEVGAKLKGISYRIRYGKDGYAIGSHFRFKEYFSINNEGEYEGIRYYEDRGFRDLTQIHCDLLVGVGLYYALPYGDLLRFNVGVNVSFKPIIEGYYHYFLTDSYGTFSVKNDFIYTQLSYIHTFNWQKARIFLKKNHVSFASKKERRKQVIEIINN